MQDIFNPRGCHPVEGRHTGLDPVSFPQQTQIIQINEPHT